MSALRTLRARLPRRADARRPPGRGPRILVIGNCQGRAAANAMRLFAPESEVTFLSVFGLPGRFGTGAALVRALRTYDVVVAGRFTAALRDGSTFDDIKATSGLLELPVIVFPAFHPDLVYVQDLSDPAGRRLVQSGVGDYHSALVLFGFLEGLTPAETRRLFDPTVYEAIGYLGLWEAASTALLEAGRIAGHDLSLDLMRWTRRGAFMHATNHPRMHVAADLAQAALRRAGIAPGELDIDAYLPDEFIRQGTWPVYPEVAARYGLDGGSTVFLTQANRVRGAPRTLPLDGFISASFEAYRGCGRSDFSCPRVTGWRSDPATWAFLRGRAGR